MTFRKFQLQFEIFLLFQEMIQNWSNQKLREEFDIAVFALKDAAEKQNNSEWHQSCFAAVMVMAAEFSARGIKINAIH